MKIFSGQIWSNNGLTNCIKKNLKFEIFCANFTLPGNCYYCVRSVVLRQFSYVLCVTSQTPFEGTAQHNTYEANFHQDSHQSASHCCMYLETYVAIFSHSLFIALTVNCVTFLLAAMLTFFSFAVKRCCSKKLENINFTFTILMLLHCVNMTYSLTD